MRQTKLVFLLLAGGGLLAAHVGSPEIYLDGMAGPYPVFITVRPPIVIPGVAQIEIRSSSPDLRELRVVPLPLRGEAAKFAPTPDQMERSKDDPQFYTGALWMMATGSWQVRVQADGAKGKGELSVPVPAIATSTKGMTLATGVILSILGIFLTVGVVAIAGASVRESQLPPGAEPNPERLRAGRIAMLVASILVAAVLYGGNAWWTADANSYANNVYKPLTMEATVDPAGKLSLRLSDPGWTVKRSLDDFAPDHNHLMHLYAIRWPQMDRVWHLHPAMTGAGAFDHDLPAMPAGAYKLYADVVHRNGFPETIVTDLNLPAPVAGKPLEDDDAEGQGPETGSAAAASFTLPDGYKMVWDRDAAPVQAAKPRIFRFHLEDASGRPPADMELYMGMLGHAAFVKTDASVFAHIHPSGSVPMPALALAQGDNDPSMDHSMHAMHEVSLPNSVGFPYGIPTAGRYRVFVQMKHGGTIETGMFDFEAR